LRALKRLVAPSMMVPVATERLGALIPGLINWWWRDNRIEVGADTRGEGPLILMLPALSSISTRSEMHPLADRLASTFTTVAVDWPGFGNRRAHQWRGNPRLTGYFSRIFCESFRKREQSLQRVTVPPICLPMPPSIPAPQAMCRRADVARATSDDDGRRPQLLPANLQIGRPASSRFRPLQAEREIGRWSG
jgi:hypothetical protein